MAFFNSAVGVLQTLVIALGAGLGIWGVINLLEGYGNDNPGAKSQGMKQLMAGGGVALIGGTLVPLLYPVRQNDRNLPLLFGIAYPVCNYDQQRVGTDRQQLLKSPVRPRFSRLPHNDMRRHLCGFGWQHDCSGQPAQRDFLPCSLHRDFVLLPIQNRRTCEVNL